MRDSVLFRKFHESLSEDDKFQFRECSLNQQKDWYINHLERTVLNQLNDQ